MSDRPRHCAPAKILLLSLPLSACDSPTAAEPLPATVEVAQLQGEAEYLAWPFTPVIGGTDAVEIRGTALAGCGTLAAEAALRGGVVSVRIVSRGDYHPCPLSRPAWQPFVATVGPLPMGHYPVVVRTVGHSGAVRGEIALEPE